MFTMINAGRRAHAIGVDHRALFVRPDAGESIDQWAQKRRHVALGWYYEERRIADGGEPLPADF